MKQVITEKRQIAESFYKIDPDIKELQQPQYARRMTFDEKDNKRHRNILQSPALIKERDEKIDLSKGFQFKVVKQNGLQDYFDQETIIERVQRSNRYSENIFKWADDTRVSDNKSSNSLLELYDEEFLYKS